MRKGWKRVHRLVVLPDYQGIGIGTRFIKAIAKMIDDRGQSLHLITTTPSLVGALAKDSEWILRRYGRDKSGMKGYERYSDAGLHHLKNTTSQKRITYSFTYKRIKKE